MVFVGVFMENYEDYLTEKFWEISSEMMKDKDINEIKKYILGFVRIVEVGLMKETYVMAVVPVVVTLLQKMKMKHIILLLKAGQTD